MILVIYAYLVTIHPLLQWLLAPQTKQILQKE